MDGRAQSHAAAALCMRMHVIRHVNPFSAGSPSWGPAIMQRRSNNWMNSKKRSYSHADANWNEQQEHKEERWRTGLQVKSNNS